MATSDTKKPNYPAKACPKCGALIHARSKSHEACGWVMRGNAKRAMAASRPGRAGMKRGASSTVSVADIQAVKTLVDRLGTTKVQQIAQVLG
ncbi:hypothetical protein AYO44_05585 [Planctomycetaceae bacterium SCGC AG-212-F19]|nr:hypothetical protein AYO44_05585 [Planctomycetaceae bacterium SCGC AG-212-F19]